MAACSKCFAPPALTGSGLGQFKAKQRQIVLTMELIVEEATPTALERPPKSA
jgi:hypothetical protein